MLCRDIMSRPVESVLESESAETAARRMRDTNVGIIAVRSPQGRIVGVITDRDLAVRVCAEGLSARDTTIGNVMTKSIIACREDHGIAQAEQLMRQYRKSRILVLDSSGGAAGIISLSDLATHDQAHAADILRNVAARELLDRKGARL